MHANDRCVFRRSMAVPAESVNSGMTPNARGTKPGVSKPITSGVFYEGIGCNWKILTLPVEQDFEKATQKIKARGEQRKDCIFGGEWG